MLFSKTKIWCRDNSGILWLKIIKIRGTSNPKYAKIGNLIIAVARHIDFNKYKEKKRIFLVLITETRYQFKRRGNIYIKGLRNCGILLTDTLSFIRTRIKGRVPLEFLRFQILGLWHRLNGTF